MNLPLSQIRRPAVAGLFYPSSPSELSKSLAGLFSEAKKTAIEAPPMALIVPHAGYPYSGRTAAKAFKLLEGHQYQTVVVVSPSHTVFFKGSAVFEGDGYETPLGVVEIDKALSKKIATMHPLVYFSPMGHASGGTRGEHALEVQLPFLQMVLGKFKLVAIVMGDQDEDSVNALGEILSSSLKGANALMVASSDLSHFHPEKEARKLDFNVQTAVERYNPDSLLEMLESGRAEACGGGIMAAIMKASKKLNGSRVQFLEYTTSAETTGDFQEVVGYLSAVIVSGESARTAASEVIGRKAASAAQQLVFTDEEKTQLRNIAKDAVRIHLENKKYSPPSIPGLDVKKGVFVTLKQEGELRGCIGQVKANKPLSEAVAEMAVAAAFDDPRFIPLQKEDLDQIEFELSVLSSLKLVHDVSDIRVGRDGLMIKLDMHSGLLLPQVAIEHHWDVIQFLENTCLKAGLPKNSYKDKNAEIFRFTAEIF